MDNIDSQYFKETNSSIILNTYRCDIFVPDAYFDAKLAVQDGELYDLFFIVKYKLYHSENGKELQKNYKDFLLPSIVTTRPDSVETAELDLYGEKEKFHIFSYYNGSEIIYNRNIIKSSIMVERFVSLLFDGKIRAPYYKLNDIVNNIQNIHNTTLNVPQYIQQVAISEVYRDKNDYSVPARLILTDADKTNEKIKALNMRQNSAFTSTLAGVSFEDINSMLTVADNRDDEKSTQMSTIEKVIRGVRS